jgi:hypothetical protein
MPKHSRSNSHNSSHSSHHSSPHNNPNKKRGKTLPANLMMAFGQMGVGELPHVVKKGKSRGVKMSKTKKAKSRRKRAPDLPTLTGRSTRQGAEEDPAWLRDLSRGFGKL